MAARQLLCAAAALLLAAAPAGHVNADGDGLFDSHTPLAVTLSGPLKTIERSKKKDERDYVAGTLTTVDGDGAPVELAVELKARGNFRRTHCRQAPLRVRFDKEDRGATLFAKQRRLKLVLPCKTSNSYEQLVVEEYLLYRVYQTLTDVSFRVRPLNLTLVDTDRKNKSRETFGFFIEDEDKMARRLGRKIGDWHAVEYIQHNPSQAALVELFMFMSGAHDWSILRGPPDEKCCHNARILHIRDTTTDLLPVPYDFDFAGIIDAPYATPPEQLPIKRVRQRYFRGRCKSAELWQETFDRFRDKREAIYALYRDEPRLSSSNRSSALGYLDDFYDIIADPQRTERTITGRCIN